MGPLEHGMCCSIYFAAEDLALELSYSLEPIDQEAWIDPEVVALAGISADELQRKQPPGYQDQAVRWQEIAAAPGPHMSNYPGVYTTQ